MRIIYDHQIVGSQEFGGASRYVYEVARAMATTHGQDVTVISPLFANNYLKTKPAALRVVGMPIPRIPRTGRIVRGLNSLLVGPMMRALSPDLVHETYYSRRRTAPRSAKVVVTVYDMIHERFSCDFSAHDPTSRQKALTVARADHVICISEQTRQDLIDILKIDRAKTTVVHLGVSLTNGAEPPASTSPAAARPFLLYVGYRGGYKNFNGLLRAFAASPILRDAYDLVCFGGDELKRTEIDTIREMGLPIDRVRQTSGDDALLGAYYRSASALVYPSFYEGFGIPPLEAMSCDCPVVCSSASSMPEVVGDAAELFDPNRPESIRTAIERVVSDTAYRQSLIQRGRERIKLFSWARCAQETFDVYRRVMS